MEYCEKQVGLHVVLKVFTLKILIDYMNKILHVKCREMGLKSLYEVFCPDDRASSISK
jgi:hypothetical protein